MNKEIQDFYIFNITDIGNRVIKATYKNLVATADIKIVGSNIASTEENDSHFHFLTNDNMYLNTKKLE